MADFMRRRAWPIVLALALAAFCAVWLSQTWSLSSYGVVLRALGATDTGLVLGTPRGGSSDEWGQTTPFTQATVNNGFQRYNRTSLYGEDLRMPYSMPLFDWALAFKPDKWLYPFVNPAYAFSFQWLFYLLSFALGYTLLFRRLGFAAVESAALMLVLFYTAFVQFWWMLYAPTFALFPWVLLACAIRDPRLQFVAVLFVATSWMLGHFYPPLFVTLAPLGAIIVYRLWAGIRPTQLVVPALAFGLACALAIVYLREPLIAMAGSIYPGQRRLNGGGVSGEMLAQHLWPAAWLVDFNSTIKSDATLNDQSVVGTYYLLFVAVFLDYARAFVTKPDPRTRRYLWALACLMGILLAWQVLPIPHQWAIWTGLAIVPPVRTMFAFGLAALLLAAHAGAIFGLRFSARRVALFGVAVLLGWGLTKATLASDLESRIWPDLVILPIVAVALVRHRAIQSHRGAVAALCCALWGALAFGGYNPLQSAWPIFNRTPTTMTRLLDYEATFSPDRVVVADKFGAVLNGWGYRSVAHILMVPHLELWRRYFPDLPAAELNDTFNRFLHVLPTDEPALRFLQPNVIGVPRRTFEQHFRWPVDIVRSPGPVPHAHDSGNVEAIKVRNGRLVVSGWAPWRGLASGQSLTMYTDSGLRVVHFERVRRPDVVAALKDAALEFAGFEIELEGVARSEAVVPARACVVATEPSLSGGILLADGVAACAPMTR